MGGNKDIDEKRPCSGFLSPDSSGKLNCWEFMRCDREIGGARARELGVCPAAYNLRFDGVHDGICAGRACWAVAGTLCGGAVQGTFAQKRTHCDECVFYEYVKSKEGDRFIPPAALLTMPA